MLVQDDDAVRRSHRVNLELHGFDVMEASTGGEALRHARRWSPDLVVLDLMLGSLDGWETLGELKTDGELGRIPVLILTSSAEESDELRALERGALAFIAKPISIEDLVAAMSKALRNPP